MIDVNVGVDRFIRRLKGKATMPQANFVKARDVDFALQLTHFAARLPNYQTTLGFTSAMVTAAANDGIFFNYMLNWSKTVKQNASDMAKSKTIFRKGPTSSPTPPAPLVLDPGSGPTTVGVDIEGRFRSLAARIKAHPAYTDAMGSDLGIIGPDSPPAPTPSLLKAVALPNGVVQLKFVKAKNPGISLECKRDSDADYVLLGTVLRSPYVDARTNHVLNQPEVRLYRYRFISTDGAPTGSLSAITQVTTEP
ncbi:MAG: hypothetical protein ABJA67_15345 [Chthonomonadales bacterium]